MIEDCQGIISELVERARKAQSIVSGYTQEQIDDVCLAIGWEVYQDENIQILARMAVEETSMGNVEDKIKKHKNKILGVLNDIKDAPSVGLIEKNEKKGIFKYAKPVGVVGALTPVTNPTATPGSNAISVLKGRNAVIFAPHPSSRTSSAKAIEFMRNGLEKVGAPKDLIQIIKEPSIPMTNELMKQVDIVLATGGGAMVKAAYASGTPAYGVGPGNSVQMIAEDADIEDAAAKVALSKCFDYATSCSSENSVVIQKDIYQQFVDALISCGGYVCEGTDRKKLEAWMWRPNSKGIVALNPKIIAKSAQVIASEAGISMPDNTRMILVEGTLPLEKDKFSEEKLSPVLTLWKYGTFMEGVELLEALTDHCGTGHSCGIHTKNDQYVEYLGVHMKTSRIMVNQSQAPANGGNFFNGMPSTVTLGCGSWGGNITTENINYRHFLNITWLSKPIEPHKPTDDQIFGNLFKKYGAGSRGAL